MGYIQTIQTKDGPTQIDYNALANLPTSDKTLTLPGSFADAKVVGDEIAKVKSSTQPGATTEQAQQIEQNTKDITSLKEDIVDTPLKIGYDRTLQIFDAYSAINSKAISTNTGLISDNENFWISGKIKVLDNTSFICNRLIYKVAFYGQDDVLVSVETNLANNTPHAIPAECEYFILQFSKINTSWDRKNIVIASFGESLSDTNNLYYNQDIENIKEKIGIVKREKNYYGEKIDFTQLTFNALDFGIDMSKENASAQGMCIHDGKALQFYSDGTYRIVDLASKTRTSSYDYDKQRIPHANCAFFGNETPQGTNFPYVYVNAYNNTLLPKGTLYCYSLSNTNVSELIQTISIGFTDDSIWSSGNDTRPYGNFAFNSVTNELITYTLKDAEKCTRFFIFNMPSPTNGDITLTKADIKRYFDLPYFSLIQDCCCYLGKLYLLHGSVKQSRTMQVIDLNGEMVVTSVELSQINNSEPEGIDVYNGKMYYSDLGKFFELTF